MTDRELLQSAADAAGYKHHWSMDGLMIDAQCGPWNPLTDDGDALRLAVKLRLSVTHHNDVSQPHPWLRVATVGGAWTHAGPSDEFNADPCAATRRAITRAAAAIGGAR